MSATSFPDRIPVTCPDCGRRLRIPRDHIGERCRCPKCKTTFYAPWPEPDDSLVFEEYHPAGDSDRHESIETPTPPPDGATAVDDNQTDSFAFIWQQAPSIHDDDPPEPPALPAAPAGDTLPAEPAPLPQAVDPPATEKPPPKSHGVATWGPLPANVQQYQAAVAGTERISLATISPRIMYRIIFFSCWLLAPLIFAVPGAVYFELTEHEFGRNLIAAPGGFLLFCPWAARWIACRIAALLLPTVRCPGCGFELDSVSRWTVGGYTDHRERHFFVVKSLIDGRFVGHFDCPQCGSTIMLR